MTRCASCGTENPAQFRFCGSCGGALAQGGCPECGFTNPPGQRFCGRCGTALGPAGEASPAEAPLEERKLATVLFADVVGFTSLAEDTDPETLAHTVDGAFRRIGEVVVAHGGTIDKYMGDCLMAIFGVPTAHDDDAERAVAAALAIRDVGGELRFSMGINSGAVMVTAMGRDGELTVMGDTVNVAARLEKVAGPGEVLIGPLTAELVAGRVVLQEREAAVLKGKRDPVPVFEALSLRPAAGTSPESGDTVPLVGRDAELDFLVSCWRRAVMRPRASLVLLTGAAGVGKTRLIDGLVDAVGDEGHPVRVALPAYGGVGRARVAADLARQLGHGKPAADAQTCAPDAEPSEKPASAEPAQGRRDELFLMRRALERRAAISPLLVVFDDVHHATSADLDPLAKLMARVGDIPLLLVMVGRPDPGDWLLAFPSATTLHIDPLAPGDARTLASALVGDLPLEEQTATLLAGQSGGNPLHLRELVRLLRSSGRLISGPSGYRLDGPLGLPPSLHAVLGARLDALAAPEKAALQSVAIYADGATIEQVEALGLSDARPVLDQLVTAGLLRQSAAGNYEIADPLLREVAYEAVPRGLRGERHRRAAAASSTAGRARHLDLAAGFLPDDAGLRSETVDALVAAGGEAFDGFRMADASNLLGRAAHLGYEDPHGLLRLAKAQLETGLAEDALATLERISPPDGDEQFAAELLHSKANTLVQRDPARALPLLDQAAELWRAQGNQNKLAWAMSNKGAAYFDLARFTDAAEWQEAALELFRAAGDRAGALQASGFLALSRPADPRVPMWLADGLSFAEESGDLTQQRNALIVLAWFHFLRSRLGADEATALAADLAARLARVSRELGDPVMEVQGRCLSAILARVTGNFDDAQRELDRAHRVALPAGWAATALLDAVTFGAAVATGSDVGMTPPEPMQTPDPVAVVAGAVASEALLLAGRAEEALQRLGWLDSVPPDAQVVAGLLDITGGASLLILGRLNDAAPRLERVLELARLMEAGSIVVAATAMLAEVTARRGDVDNARRLLESITANPGGIAGIFIERARVALGETGARERLAERCEALRAPGLHADLSITAVS